MRRTVGLTYMTGYSRSDLLAMLRSTDPAERDEIAYFGMVQRVASGAEDASLVSLGDEMAARLGDQEIQARTFAALILGEVVDRDRVTGLAPGEAVARWRDAFAAWYPAETDLRGWDERLGWLHAVAHGSDALAAFGRSPRLDRAGLCGLLDVARARLLAPTEYVLRDQEDDRLGYALALVLSRPELGESDAVGWLEPVTCVFAAGQPGPVPPHLTNTMRTLRALYLLCDRGFRFPEATAGEPEAPVTHVAYPTALKAALADALRLAWPYVA
jgi:hypothetical protein